jgi:hypothetical protein
MANRASTRGELGVARRNPEYLDKGSHTRSELSKQRSEFEVIGASSGAVSEWDPWHCQRREGRKAP